MQHKTATVNGITMRWQEQGEGTPLVLVHGIPTCPALWRHVVPRLNGVRCLAWEMVGYGASIPQGRDRDISVKAQAGYMADWLRSLGVERAILAGHDLGGGVVQIAAVRQPRIAAGLFLTNAIGYDSWPIPSVKAMRAAGPAIRYLPNAAFAGVVRSFLARGHDDGDRAAEAFGQHWPHYQRADGAAAFVRQVNALNVQDTLDVQDRLPSLGIPARVVWGAADAFQKLQYGERFARDLGAPLRRIEGARHFTPEDHPEVVAEELQALVEQVKSAAGAATASS